MEPLSSANLGPGGFDNFDSGISDGKDEGTATRPGLDWDSIMDEDDDDDDTPTGNDSGEPERDYEEEKKKKSSKPPKKGKKKDPPKKKEKPSKEKPKPKPPKPSGGGGSGVLVVIILVVGAVVIVGLVYAMLLASGNSIVGGTSKLPQQTQSEPAPEGTDPAAEPAEEANPTLPDAEAEPQIVAPGNEPVVIEAEPSLNPAPVADE